MAASVAAGSLYVLAGGVLWQALQLVALPSVDALLHHHGLPTITRPAESTAPIGDEPTGYEWATWPEGSPRTAAPAARASLPLAIGTGPARVAEAGDPNPSPATEPPSNGDASAVREQLRGRASWVHAGLGDRYLAARMPKGTGLRICGALGCVTRIVIDYGPSKRKHPDRIVDLSRADFAEICGHPETLGTCPVRVTVLGRIAPPETDTP